MMSDVLLSPASSLSLFQLSPPALPSELVPQVFSPRGGLPWPQESCGSSSCSLPK